jgi:hypothetical protein
MQSKRVQEMPGSSGANKCMRPIYPPYQRQYQWNSERWQSFVSDVSNAAGGNSADPPHWLGILLLSNDP